MKKRILVVDRQPGNYSQLQKKLPANSYEMFYARDMEDVVKRFDVKLADLLLVDLDVPAQQVCSALVQVTQLNPSLRVIGVTERSEGSEIAVRERLNGVVEKPIAQGKLLAFIQELLTEQSPWTEFRYVAPVVPGPRERPSHRTHELCGYPAAYSRWGIND